MSDFVFALKMLAFAVVIVVLMQIRVGGESIESRAESFIRTAGPVLVLRDVAEGALLVIHDGWASLMSNINSKYSNKFDKENLPGERSLSLSLQRSQAYLEEEKQKREAYEEKVKARAAEVRQALGLSQSEEKSERR